MPGTAVTVFEEGLAIPPIRIYREGKRNDEAFTIIRQEHARAGDAGSGSGFRDRGDPHGRAADGGIVRTLRERDGRGLLPGDPRQVPRHLRDRAPAEDPRRRVRVGGFRRARRRHRPEPPPARAAHGEERRADHARLQRHRAAVVRADQLAGRLRRRRVSHQVDRADPAQPRRYARAGGGDPRQRGRVRGLRRDLPAEGHADHAGVAGGDQRALVRAAAFARPARRASSRRRPAGACRPTRRRSAIPGSTAPTRTVGPSSRAR